MEIFLGENIPGEVYLGWKFSGENCPCGSYSESEFS